MADAPHLEAAVPVYINGYLKRGVIVNGLFAKVYLVTRNHQNFAMKELQRNQPTNQNEIAILSSLKHRNVVSYVNHFSDVTLSALGGAKLYIVMEYCELGTLMRILQLENREGVNERFIAIVMAMICCGMKHIHSKRVIHRDIKPDNIFIKRDGVLKIGGFGQSTVLQPATLITGRIGTDGYMSPECEQGRQYGYPSDMWSIGRVLHDLCHCGEEQIPDTNNLIPLKERLWSDEPSSRPTATQALLLFCKIEQNLRQGNPVGAFAGNNGAGLAVGGNDVVYTIIDFLGRYGFLNWPR